LTARARLIAAAGAVLCLWAGSAGPAGAVLTTGDYRQAIDRVSQLTTAALTPRTGPDTRMYYLARGGAELSGLLALRLDRRGEFSARIKSLADGFKASLDQVRTRPGQLLAAVIYHYRQMAVLSQVSTTGLGRRRLEAYRAKMAAHIDGLLAKLKGSAALKVAVLGVCRMADVWAAALIKPADAAGRKTLEQEEAGVKTLVMDVHRLSAEDFIRRALQRAYGFVRLASISLDGSLQKSFDRMDQVRRRNPVGPGLDGAVRAYESLYQATRLLAAGMAK
jgi:hypothetical protein